MKERKFIVTLNKPVFNGKQDIKYMYCDLAFSDVVTGKEHLEIRIDSESFLMPLHNILGVFKNVNYKEMPERITGDLFTTEIVNNLNSK